MVALALGMAMALQAAPAAPAATPVIDDPARLAALAARCGSEIAWTTTWPEARQRAKETGRPILALVRAYSGIALADMTMVVPFMEEPIVELVRDRFVALRFKVGDAAPFTAPELYGIGPLAFGTTFLVVDADGRVRGDTFTVETTTLHDFLRLTLPEAQRPPPIPRGEAGLATLEQEAATAAPERKGKLALQRAELLTRLGRAAEALALLDAFAPDDPLAPAVLFLRGIAETAESDKTKARATWSRLLDDHAANRWAWYAAALLPLHFLDIANGGIAPWPADEIAAMVPLKTRAPLPAGRASEAEQGAIRFLLDAQRSDGSWIFPGEVVEAADRRDAPLVAAITSLAARALMPVAAEPGADARVEATVARALAFLKEVASRSPVVSPVLDHHVWARASLLRCLATAVEAGFAEPDEWHDALATTTKALLATQRKGGGFSYYQGPDPEYPDPQLEISFSFVTAYVLLALREAQAVGVDVPDDAIERAAGCLARCREMNGTFSYALSHRDESAGRDPKPSGAAGRGPECAWTLALCGRAETGDVVRALDHFLACSATYAREQGKTLMHCGPEGEGSHYLLFDYAFAAQAAASLPVEQRARYRGPLLDLVLAARTEAGSFVDNPIVGDHAGTALALEALRALRVPRSP